MFYSVISCNLVFFGGRISHPSFVLLFFYQYIFVSFPIKKKKNTPFIKQLITGKIAALAIYVDDIIVAMDDIEEMDKLKK